MFLLVQFIAIFYNQKSAFPDLPTGRLGLKSFINRFLIRAFLKELVSSGGLEPTTH
jgi:hypothetical protein